MPILDGTEILFPLMSNLEDPQTNLPTNMLHSVLGELKLLRSSLKPWIMLVFFPSWFLSREVAMRVGCCQVGPPWSGRMVMWPLCSQPWAATVDEVPCIQIVKAAGVAVRIWEKQMHQVLYVLSLWRFQHEQHTPRSTYCGTWAF